jgi:PAS domain S-box-containing protein
MLAFLKQVPAYIFWKDKNSVYLGCNNALACSLGLKSPAEIIRKTDYDLPTTKEESDSFRAVDKQVIESGLPKFNIIEHQTLPNGKKMVLLTNKAPIFDKKNNVKGIIANSVDITEAINKQIHLLDKKSNLESLEKSVAFQDILKQIQQKRYYLTGKFKNIYLTKREAECILCLARGFTNKQMAGILGISNRTVETLMEKLRIKLNCNLRSELIAVAIEGGFLEGIRAVV